MLEGAITMKARDGEILDWEGSSGVREGESG